MEKIRTLITTLLLSQLLVENIDKIESDYPELFRRNFKYKGKRFADECAHILDQLLTTMTEEGQLQLWKQIEILEAELVKLLQDLNHE